MENPLFFQLCLVLLAFIVLFRITQFYQALAIMAGAWVLAQAWGRLVARGFRYRRVHEQRAFWGEEIPVRLELTNRSLLPAPWVRLDEELPPALATTPAYRRIVTLSPRGRQELRYTLHGTRRGYYRVGPLYVDLGDVLGAVRHQLRGPATYVTVYPRIVPLQRVGLPSTTPLGEVRARQPLYEDPARVAGMREYQRGDSVRRINWKASAATGRLQVRLYEPAISVESVIFLDMSFDGYTLAYRDDAMELAVVVAASVAYHIAGLRQAVGLVTNGVDAALELPLARPAGTYPLLRPEPDGTPQQPGTPEQGGLLMLPPGKGRERLMQVLELLARVQGRQPALPIAAALSAQAPRLPWGALLIVITGEPTQALVDALYAERRRGFRTWLIATQGAAGAEALAMARALGIRADVARDERALPRLERRAGV
jgi:uncharacterized protein (DUF58 family)